MAGKLKVFFASQKCRRKFDDEINDYYQKGHRKYTQKWEAEGNFVLVSSISSAAYLRKVAEVKCKDMDRTQNKVWWSEVNSSNTDLLDAFFNALRSSIKAYSSLVSVITFTNNSVSSFVQFLPRLVVLLFSTPDDILL